MMKKLFFLALSLLLLCGLLASCGEKEPTPNPVSDFKYEENAEGGITITGMTRAVMSSDKEKVVIPSEIEDKKVTKIADNAFTYQGMDSIYIPDTVVSIGELAFAHNQQLSEVRFSKKLATMGKSAFCDCLNLKNVTLPSSLVEVPYGAFMGSAVESVVFEEGITAIEPYAFYGTPLTSIDIPASIQTIGERAFGDCLYLKSIALHDGLVTIGDYAFGGRVSPSNKLTAVTIPKTVTSMTQDAFFRATLLESLTFEGNAPANYGERFDSELNYTVYYHQSATGFSFPRWNGYSTRVIENKDLTPLLYEGFEYADDGAGGIKIMAYLGDATEVTVPATINGKAVTIIASCCFMDEELVAVTIPNTVKTIEGKAFLNCKELRTVNLSEGLTDIEMQAFCYCYKLESIVLPGTLKTLGEEAFRYCEALQQITVPASVTTWGFGVFEYSGVKNVTLQEGLATLGEFAFGYSALQAIEIPASITVIPTEAFSS
ncbi:MAG: leucine-rich repeat domain-containing protein [Clostridia bacterium]|nr:leucine-rich repeat domain-containing protein [Clostridia bacterium]